MAKIKLIFWSGNDSPLPLLYRLNATRAQAGRDYDVIK
jgi:hypothetical protein